MATEAVLAAEGANVGLALGTIFLLGVGASVGESVVGAVGVAVGAVGVAVGAVGVAVVGWSVGGGVVGSAIVVLCSAGVWLAHQAVNSVCRVGAIGCL